jgi:hypothetical protein
MTELILPTRRRFLAGLVGLIAAPAVVKAEALMPIVVWRPTFGYTSHGGGMGPWVTCAKSELLGVDLTLLGLPPGHDWNGQTNSWYWSPKRVPLASLPRDKVHIPQRLQQELELSARRAALVPIGPANPSPSR